MKQTKEIGKGVSTSVPTATGAWLKLKDEERKKLVEKALKGANESQISLIRKEAILSERQRLMEGLEGIRKDYKEVGEITALHQIEKLIINKQQ